MTKPLTMFLIVFTVAASLLVPDVTRAQTWDPEKTLGITVGERLEGSDPITPAEIATLNAGVETRAIATFIFVTNLTPYPLIISRGREGRNVLGLVPPTPVPIPIPVVDWVGDTIMWARTMPGLPPQGRYWKRTFRGSNVAAAWAVTGAGTAQ